MRNLLSKVLPDFIKRPVSAYIRAVADSDPAHVNVGADTERPYFQSHPTEYAYFVTPTSSIVEGLPVPPEQLWVGYGPDIHTYISNGKKDVTEMVRIIEASGVAVANTNRVLEFGCAAARMLRHVPEFAPNAQLWGVDISSEHIQWCVNHITPAMHFATTTTIPHLPFEDQHFDLIFCGSVFTHIEDMQQAWFLELA